MFQFFHDIAKNEFVGILLRCNLGQSDERVQPGTDLFAMVGVLTKIGRSFFHADFELFPFLGKEVNQLIALA